MTKSLNLRPHSTERPLKWRCTGPSPPLFLDNGDTRIPSGHLFDSDGLPNKPQSSLERAYNAGFVDLVNEKIKADPLPEPRLPLPPKAPPWNIFD